MKLEGYNQAVSPAAPQSPVVHAVNDLMAYGRENGLGVGLGAIKQGLETYARFEMKRNDEEDRSNIIAAMDAYNKGRYNIMYNEDTGLMHKQGESANGITQSYVEQDKELQSQILGNVKLHDNRNKNALLSLITQGSRQGLQQVDQWQYKQGEVVKDANLKGNIDNLVAFLQKDYKTEGAIDAALGQAKLYISGRYGTDIGEDILKEKIKQADIHIIGSVITGAVNNGDYNSANVLLDKYENLLGDEVTGKLKNYYFNAINARQRMENAQLQEAAWGFEDDVFQMKNSGKSYQEAYNAAIQTAGSNYKMRNALVSIVNGYYGGTGGVGSAAMHKSYMAQLKNAIDNAAFPDWTSISALLDQMGATVADRRDIKIYYEKSQGCASLFSELGISDKDLLKFASPDGLDINNKKNARTVAIMESAVKKAVAEQVYAFRQKNNGQKPSIADIAEMAKLSLTLVPIDKTYKENGWLWDSEEQLKVSPAMLTYYNAVLDKLESNSELANLIGNSEAADNPFKKYQSKK